MITLKDFLEVTNYQYTESSQYCWKCFGDTAQSMDYWNREDDGFSMSITHDLLKPIVYMMEVCDYKTDRAYRWINPDYKNQYIDEAEDREVNPNEAWDDIDYVNTAEGTMLGIAKELMDRKDDNKEGIISYDQEGMDDDGNITLRLDKSEILALALEAHRNDITINKMVERLLTDAMKDYRNNEVS